MRQRREIEPRRLADGGAVPGWRSRPARPARRRPAGSAGPPGARRSAVAIRPPRPQSPASTSLPAAICAEQVRRPDSPRFLPSPISRDSRLRAACASCASVSSARHSRSSASTSPARGGRPRRARPRSNSSGFSRIHRRSCISMPGSTNLSSPAMPSRDGVPHPSVSPAMSLAGSRYPARPDCRRRPVRPLPPPRAWRAPSRPCGRRRSRPRRG